MYGIVESYQRGRYSSLMYFPGEKKEHRYLPVLDMDKTSLPAEGFDISNIIGLVQNSSDARRLIFDNLDRLYQEEVIAVERITAIIERFSIFSLIIDDKRNFTPEIQTIIDLYGLDENLITIQNVENGQVICHPVYVPIFKE